MTSSTNPNRAIIAGVGQIRRNPKFDEPFSPTDPATLMAWAAQKALNDTATISGVQIEEITKHLGVLACVEPITFGYDDLGLTVHQAGGFSSTCATTTWPPGGNSPGDLLNEITNQIVAGEIELAVICGSETLYSKRRCAKEGIELNWPSTSVPRDFLRGQRQLTTELESRHGLNAPINCYPLFENALRHKAKRSIVAHQQFLGDLMERNSKVASKNPYSWFPRALTSSQIQEVSEANRMICFPYTKAMNAIMEVDMAAAIVVMSTALAKKLGLAQSMAVTILGGASAHDAWTPSERADFVSSPAIATASSKALELSAIDVSQVDKFDFYSCFPSAVEMATSELGLSANDPRGLSVTGGLAYCGGPGNSYSLHSLATMTELIRSGKATTGMVSSLGMTASKHAYNILSNSEMLIEASQGTTQRCEVPNPEVILVDETSGSGVVETYTAQYDRNATITSSVFVVALDGGGRTVANGPIGDLFEREIWTTEFVGKPVMVNAGDVLAQRPNTITFSC